MFPTGWTEIDGFLIGPGAGLTNADLSGVDLAGALVDGTNLSNANLTNADLLGEYPDVSTSTFTGATWSNTTCRDGTSSDIDGAPASTISNLCSPVTGVLIRKTGAPSLAVGAHHAVE